ncbi:MAG: hypothetical protein IH941_07305, partial [Acidobacteria bacterium]|nr:hypothetical protein [Acidobacteriota bacterium]
MIPDYQQLCLRCWVDYPNRTRKKKTVRRNSKQPPIKRILVIDAETTADEVQRLLFGSARYARLYRHNGVVTAVLLNEWLFHADDLEQRDPTGYETLVRYAAERGIELLSRSEFVERCLWWGGFVGGATIVGFNLPFDLSRLALHVGNARPEEPDSVVKDGFSFALWGRPHPTKDKWQEHFWRPRLLIKKFGPGRAFIQWGRPKKRDNGIKNTKGSFLDCHTLDAALSGVRRSLKRACKAMGVPEELSKGRTERHGVITDDYITYNRQDVTATAHLCAALLTELERHTDIDLQATQTFSPASLAKAYRRATNVGSLLDRWPDTPEHQEILYASMHAYMGGLTEVLLRLVLAGVVPVDFLSMYPTVMELLGIWDYLTAERVDIIDCTEELRALLDRVAAEGPEVLQDPALWRHMVGYVWLRPNSDLLPTRVKWGEDRHQLGIHPLTIPDIEIPWAIPDVLAAAARKGAAPDFIRASRMVPVGKRSDLKSVKLRGELDFDPTTQSLYRAIIELRKEVANRPDLDPAERERLDLALKLIANSLYGILVEFNRDPVDQPEDAIVHRLDGPCETQVDFVEIPGKFCDPPLGSCITAAGRLMLGLAERVAGDLGLLFAFSDTDSLALTTQTGDPPPAEKIAALQEWFEPLHPYDRDKVPQPLLELDKPNFDTDGNLQDLEVYAISPKRYNLTHHTDDGFEVVKGSESGLGHLLDPTRRPELDPDTLHSDSKGNRGWIDTLHERAINQALGTPFVDPEWLDRPAVIRVTITTPEVHHHFDKLNKGRNYTDSIKPFNFAITVIPDPRAAAALGRDNIRLIAPANPDPDQWENLDWIDAETGDTCRITTDPTLTEIICEYPLERDPDDDTPELIPVKSYRNIADAWATNPISKATASDGTPVTRTTSGPLRRRRVRSSSAHITYIGKESHGIGELQAGLADQTDVLTEYSDPDIIWDQLIAPAVAALGIDRVARRAGIHPSTVQRALDSVNENDNAAAIAAPCRMWSRQLVKASSNCTPRPSTST